MKQQFSTSSSNSSHHLSSCTRSHRTTTNKFELHSQTDMVHRFACLLNKKPKQCPTPSNHPRNQWRRHRRQCGVQWSLSLPLYAPCVPIIISLPRLHRDSIPILPLTLPPLALAFLMRLNFIPRRAHQQQKQWNQRQVNLRAPLMSPKHTAATYGGQRE